MNRVIVCGIVLLLSSGGGCDSGPEGPETAPVVGFVTLDGNPLAGADVFLHPVAGDDSLQACQTVTDSDGRFTVSTHVAAGEYKPGMIPGEYLVSISKLDSSQVTSAFTPPANVLPAKYESPDTSGFTATVAADKENEFEFRLLSESG